MKTQILGASLLILMASACSGDPSSLPTKGDLAGKSDGDSSQLCVQADLPADCDLCLEMGWYGDGTCERFCENPDPDCGSSVPAAISTQFGGGALPPIHPQLGVWTIYRPGVYPALSWYGTARELADAQAVSWALEPVSCALNTGESSFDPCSEADNQEMGCFLGQEGEYNPISAIHRLMAEYDLGAPSADDKAAAAATEAAIEYVVRAEVAGAEFYYGMIDGKLYLLAVDVASLDCSA